MDETVNSVLDSVKKYVHKNQDKHTQDAPVAANKIEQSSGESLADTSDVLTDAAASTAPERHYHASVHEIVNASHQMLNFAACAGKEVDAKISATITEFSHKVVRRQEWTSEEETEFLGASSSLAKFLAPVTYESLESSTHNRADRFVKIFGMLAVLLLLTLVFAQCFWVIVNNATQTIDLKQVDMTNASMNIEMLANQNLALSNKLDILVGKRSASAAGKEEDIQTLKEAIQKNKEGIALNSRKYNQSEDLLNSSARILAYWLPFQNSIATEGGDISFRNTLLTTWAKQILQGMSAYLLPLIYGLVGACAFVLRALSRQIRERTFSKTDSVIQFGLRLVLGALAGISIGWFLNSETPSDHLVASLSPLALAFIAGYSVELVFTAVDKIISAFTGSGPGESRVVAS